MKWRRLSLSMSSFAAALILSAVCSSAFAAERLPNIVVILADDLGYGDVGAYNPQSKIATPNIDRLAQQGIRFTDAHAAASCVPSRYELLTGRYRFRTRRVSQKQALIEPSQVTVASLLKKAGYTTAMVGKWHLGFDGAGIHPGGGMFDYTKPLRGGPADHGFDSFFGIHASLDVAPYFYIENDRPIQIPTDSIEEHHTAGMRSIQGEFWRGGKIASDFKHEEVLSRFLDRAARYVESQEKSQQPFFLYLALTAPHTPWLPLHRFRGESGAGMYGEFVMQVDEVVGRVVTALEEAGKANDTLLIFTSDNGPTWFEADIQRYGHRAAGTFRGMKADAWEGGHRVPFIARWPRKIRAGTSSAQLVSFTDMLATFASLTEQELPEDAGEDSFDALPALLGKSTKRSRNSIVHDAWGPDGLLLAIRHGNWKLIPSSCGLSMIEGYGDGAKHTSPCLQEPQLGGQQGQLYNLTDDPREQTNVYAENPRIVKYLTELLERYRREGRSRGLKIPNRGHRILSSSSGASND